MLKLIDCKLTFVLVEFNSENYVKVRILSEVLHNSAVAIASEKCWD